MYKYSQLIYPISRNINRVQKRNFIRFIDTATVGIKTTFGKAGGLIDYDVVLKPGFHIYLPIIQEINQISNRLRQNNYNMTVKTKDNVFADLDISVQWQIKPENSEKAFFALENPKKQIQAYIENVIRSSAPKSTLDELFTQHGEISKAINETLVVKLENHGYTIVETQITNIEPDIKVMSSMNEINASERLREVERNKAEAKYISQVRDAEGRAEAKRLQGEGISNMRKAIMEGYAESINEISEKSRISPEQVIDLVKYVQRLEVQEAIGTADNSNRVIFTTLDESAKFRNTVMEARTGVVSNKN